MTQQVKNILDNLLFKYEDAEDDIVILQAKFEQMDAQLKTKNEEIAKYQAAIESYRQVCADYDTLIDRFSESLHREIQHNTAKDRILAWNLLCRDTANGLHQYDNWDDVPDTTKELYLAKAAKAYA